MTFDNKNMQYRVTLNTDLNLFIVFDKNNKNHVATGVTIEKAVQELQKQNRISFIRTRISVSLQALDWLVK